MNKPYDNNIQVIAILKQSDNCVPVAELGRENGMNSVTFLQVAFNGEQGCFPDNTIERT